MKTKITIIAIVVLTSLATISFTLKEDREVKTLDKTTVVSSEPAGGLALEEKL